MTALVLRGDARTLPLPDESADLIVTSPPYFGLRDYGYDGQLGSEPTSAEFLDALWVCTAEMVRVLKPTGSIFVNLGDKYGRGTRNTVHGGSSKQAYVDEGRPGACPPTGHDKSLLGLPWRYAIGCIDDLGLILRAEIVWDKPNGLPESVTDRVRRSHEQWFHFTKQPRYYAAVDEIREPHVRQWDPSTNGGGHTYAKMKAPGEKDANLPTCLPNPLGKLPGSVWEIPSEPLSVPPELGDHFAAFPTEWPKRLILGWSPPGICVQCGQGRRPVVTSEYDRQGRTTNGPQSPARRFESPGRDVRAVRQTTITGYACACTPHTDHPGTGQRHRNGDHPSGGNAGVHVNAGTRLANLGGADRVGPWREYHLDDWTPPPIRPAVVLDPFGGTGTTALVASVLGRLGVTVDLSPGYCRLARWRVSDEGQRAKVLGMPKPELVPEGQLALDEAE